MVLFVKNLKLLKNHKYEVLFSNDEKIICSEELVLKYRLVKDKELKSVSLKDIYQDIEYYNNYELALNYLKRGLKSKFKIDQYLKEKSCDKAIRERVISSLEEKNLLNDLDYFMMLTDHYIKKGYGRYYIEKMGNSEKIDSNIIANVLSVKTSYDYMDPLRNLANKYYKTIKGENKILKLKKYLYSHGYEMDLINEIIKEIEYESREN